MIKNQLTLKSPSIHFKQLRHLVGSEEETNSLFFK